MECFNPFGVERVALLGSNRGCDQAACFRIIFQTIKEFAHPFWYTGAAFFGKAGEAFEICDRQDTGNDRGADAGLAGKFQEPHEHIGIKEKLSDGPVRTRIELGPQVIHVRFGVQ